MNAATPGRDFLINKRDLKVARMADGPLGPPAVGQALLKVDTFALTANNITVVEAHGEAAVTRAYRDLLDGKTRPDEGCILSLHA